MKVRKEILLEQDVVDLLQKEADKKKWTIRIYLETIVVSHFNKISKQKKA